MPVFSQSPAVTVTEKDASAVTIGTSTSVAGTVGTFRWGPVMTPVLVTNEADFVSLFGQPDNSNFDSFYNVANTLLYTNAVYVNRVDTFTNPLTGHLNAVATGTGVPILNSTDYDTNYADGQGAAGTFAARYPGAYGNSLLVSIADSATFAEWPYKNQFQGEPKTSDYALSKGGSNDELHVIVIDTLGKFTGTVGGTLEKFSYVSKGSDAVSFDGLSNYYANVLRNRSQYIYWMDHPDDGTNWGNSVVATAFTSLVPTTISVNVTGAAQALNVATLTFASQPTAPFTVGQSITVAGITPSAYNGTFTVTAVTTTTVKYALTGTVAAGTVFGTVADTTSGTIHDFTYQLQGGSDGDAPINADYQLAWDTYANVEDYSISLFPTGKCDAAMAKYVVDNIGEVRRDCLVFASICTSTGEPIFGTSTTALTDASDWKTTLGNSTYAVFDSGYKYQYDKYNDKYRWIALNADIAGLCAQVDRNQDTWVSPAGITKGQIRGAAKLSWNPNKAQRDTLYNLAINPVVTFTGQGTMLFGDKTGTTKPSAFDRINVRRLFLVLEKSIERSAKYQLFEQNDEITRLQFIASIEPFLRDVQGRRGIDSFKVICDTTNNTPQVIQTNEFRATILIRPVYSINFISLTFTATGASVTFETAALV